MQTLECAKWILAPGRHREKLALCRTIKTYLSDGNANEPWCLLVKGRFIRKSHSITLSHAHCQYYPSLQTRYYIWIWKKSRWSSLKVEYYPDLVSNRFIFSSLKHKKYNSLKTKNCRQHSHSLFHYFFPRVFVKCT